MCALTINLLNPFLSLPQDVSPGVMKQAVLQLGPTVASKIFTYMYANHTPKVPTVGLWEDAHLGELRYRDLLRQAIVMATAPPLAASPSTALGMRNEGGNDCYLVACWTLLLNIPRLRNQVLKNLRGNFNGVDLQPLRNLAIYHLQTKAAGTTTPLPGSQLIRRLVTDGLGNQTSGNRQGDAGEALLLCADASYPASSLLPNLQDIQHMRNGDNIVTPPEQSPIRISPSSPSFAEGIRQVFGRHDNIDTNPRAPAATTTLIAGPPPLDLLVSVNRRNPLDPIRLDEAYQLPPGVTTVPGPLDYTLKGFAYWTGGHYLSFYKNPNNTWTMVNDSVASIPSVDTLNAHKEKASLIYYQRNDAPSLDTSEDNRWWREAVNVPPPPAFKGWFSTLLDTIWGFLCNFIDELKSCFS